jgi:hypothetical protein
MSDPTFADAILQIQHLTVTAADLTRRLEAAERELVALRPLPGWTASVTWTAADGSGRYVCGHADGTYLHSVVGGAYEGGYPNPHTAAAASDAARRRA